MRLCLRFRCHLIPSIARIPAENPRRVCLSAPFTAQFLVFLQLCTETCVSECAWSSAEPRSPVTHTLAPKTSALACAGGRASAILKRAKSWTSDFPSAYALWPPCRHPTLAHTRWRGKRVMAGVGEEGRADDVMREDHRERTQAATVPTCASFPSGLSGLRWRSLASSFVLLKIKKKADPYFNI